MYQIIEEIGMPKRLCQKIWLIMRLTTVILIACLMQVSASGLAQKITLNQRNVPLNIVLKEIRKQSGFDVYSDRNSFPKNQRVTVVVNNGTVEEALNQAFMGLKVTYKIEGNTIAVRKREEQSLLKRIVDQFQTIDVSGRIINEEGLPIAGATIKLKDGSQTTMSNRDGYFTLKNVNEDAIVVISVIGYKTYEISAKHQLGPIQLEISNTSLMEVVINKGYYTEKQQLSVGNAVKISAKDIENQPVGNPLLALQGRVPGLFINQTNGIPGGGVTTRVQGSNSITRGTDPLFIVDGVPYISQMPSSTYGGPLGSSGGPIIANVASGNGNPLNFINPNDVESIEVLKDADATAIYGSRAANGAILITTRKGQVGAPKLDLNLQTGTQWVAQQAKLLNTEQYLVMRNEAYTNDGKVVGANPTDPNYAPDLTFWDTKRYTDWQKQLIGRHAHVTNLQASISGGDNINKYLFSGFYRKEGTVFPGDFADQKSGIHFSLNSSSPDKKFKLQLSANYMHDLNQLPNSDLTSMAMLLPPNAPTLYNPDGSLNWMQNSIGNSTWTNPLARLINYYKNETNNLINNGLINYSITSKLEFVANMGYTYLQTNEFLPSLLTSKSPETRATSTRTASYGNNNVNSWILEPQFHFHTNLFGGTLNTFIGSTFQKINSKGSQLTGSGYNSDEVLQDIKSASSVTVGRTIASTYKYNAIFGRLGYNYSDKYIFDIVGRRDGSSRFGSKNQFHNFGSIGAAWLFSNENFLNISNNLISFGKLRFSYGTTGNDQIGDYQFLNLYSPTSANIPYQNVTGLSLRGLPNPYLEWELTKKFQTGLDLGFFKNRFFMTINFVRNQSSNELLPYSLPITTGFSSITSNFPAKIQNTAWEFSTSAPKIKLGKLSWSTSLNLTIPKNKLIEFPNLATSSYADQLIIGKPISIVKAYHFMDVDPATGIYRVADKNGNPTTDPDASTDRTALIDIDPQYYGGLQNTFSYRGFEFSLFFQFVKQIAPNYKYSLFPQPGQLSNGYGNQLQSSFDRWRNIGDVQLIQRFATDFSYSPQASNAAGSDAGFSDASYIRLKHMSLSWELPFAWKNAIRIKTCKFYVMGQNLITITPYKWLDPEIHNMQTLPPLRNLTIGTQISF